MRSILLACAIVTACFCASDAVASESGEAHRSVQVIIMGANPASVSAARIAVPDGGNDGGTAASANPLPEGFRSHDLSRRWVAFEMARSFAAIAARGDADGQDPSTHIGTAPMPFHGPSVTVASVIAVPGWMQTGVAFSSVSMSPASGCSPGGYQPAGFLDQRTEFRRSGYYGMMSSIACEYGIPTGLFDAMIIRESGYDAAIYSPKNAFGLTQLMPATAAGLGVDRYDIEQNLRGGARYLRQQLDRFGQVHLALAAYNAGPGNVRGRALPRSAETQAYVEKVLMDWRRLAERSVRAADRKMPVAAIVPQRTRLTTVLSY